MIGACIGVWHTLPMDGLSMGCPCPNSVAADEWVVDYWHLELGPPADHMFTAPKACDGVPSQPTRASPGFTLRMLHSLPPLPLDANAGVDCCPRHSNYALC